MQPRHHWRTRAAILPTSVRHNRICERAGDFALLPVTLGLTAALRRLSRKRPDIFDRLSCSQEQSVGINPTDLPLSFRMILGGRQPRIEASAKSRPIPSDATIEAPIRTLIGVFEGRLDGDAAFFSSDLWIEGDTRLLVGLRNALEEAELSLSDLLPAAFPDLSGHRSSRQRRSRQGVD